MKSLNKIENIAMRFVLPVITILGITIGGVIAFSENTGEKILKYAEKFIGIAEITQNKGWYNKYFENLMINVGWKPPTQYCMLFVKMVLLNTLKGKQKDIVRVLFNASSQTTWKNLIAHKNLGFYKISKTPKVGAVAIYKHMNKKWAGHGDIVISFNKNNYKVVSANEKKGVEVKTRGYTFNSNKFRLLGFVHF